MSELRTEGINGVEQLDKRYLNKCLKTLESWGAPLDCWVCTKVEDIREDDPDCPLSECELCFCDKVRYRHYMEHELYFEPVIVGCICAGILEGDILKAKNRERLMRNRSKRRKNFIKRKWKETLWGAYTRTYKGKSLMITESAGGYIVNVGSVSVSTYKDKKIKNMLSAMYAAFDLADPQSEVMQ